ncbi:protein-arginine deiminase family protein [Bdellovibrio sp. HCB290]|uniref:protein-arginine deiminase family protein n=1 Tax=Bdellovibrio sp. HCB290 TaxID=3394356 RepID=UPI0039B540D7
MKKSLKSLTFKRSNLVCMAVLLTASQGFSQGLPKDTYFPTHLDAPKTLLVARNWYNYKAARDFILSVDEINKAEGSQISVMTFGADYTKKIQDELADGGGSDTLPQWKYLKLSESLPKTESVTTTHSTKPMDDWFQDIYEFYYSGENALSAIEWREPFTPGLYAPASFKGDRDPTRAEEKIANKNSAAAKAEFAKQIGLNSKTTLQYEKLNSGNDFQGGNFEPYPGDVIVVGSMRGSVTPMEKVLKGTRYENRIINLDTNWLQVGHVDETLNYIPDATANCGFRIVVPDVEKGGSLFLSISKKSLAAVPEDYQFIGKEQGLPRAGDSYIEAYEKLTSSSPKDPEDEAAVALFLKNNQFAQGKVDQLLNKFIQSYQTLVPTCKGKMDVVKLPTVFGCGIDMVLGSYEDALAKSKFSWCQAYLPNPVNFVSMGKHTLVPRQFFGALTSEVTKQLGQYTKIHWIDTVLYNSSAGNAHCASNVIRTPMGAKK